MTTTKRCTRCGDDLPASGFWKQGAGLASQCKACRTAQKKERGITNPVVAKSCRRCGHMTPAGGFAANALATDGLQSWCVACQLAYQRQKHAEVKKQVHRGLGGRCECPGCDEAGPGFLTLDHVNNDGADHRRRRGGGTAIYRDVIHEDFPRTRYRLLCFNCNFGRYYNGGRCPHEDRGRKAHVNT